MGLIAQAHKTAKREAAEARQAARQARTDQEQFGLLMDHGHGHCAEATILAERIAHAGD